MDTGSGGGGVNNGEEGLPYSAEFTRAPLLATDYRLLTANRHIHYSLIACPQAQAPDYNTQFKPRRQTKHVKESKS